MRPTRRRRQPSSSRTIGRLMFQILPLLAIFLMLVWGLRTVHQSDIFDVKIAWEIDDKTRINAQILSTKITPLLDDKYRLSLADIRRRIEDEPWVRKAAVRRGFLNELKISVQTHKVRARWEDGYVSADGALFFPNEKMDKKITENLPLLICEKNQVSAAYARFTRYQEMLAPRMIKTLRHRHADTLTIEPGIIVVLGNQRKFAQLRRFIEIYPQIERREKITAGSIFDMRYPKGFSFRPGTSAR